MRRYFLTAREVGTPDAHLLRQAGGGARQAALHRPVALLPARGRAPAGGAGRRPARASAGGWTSTGRRCSRATRPCCVRLFVEADRRDLDLHPDAFAAGAPARSAWWGRQLRRSPAAAEAFLDVLAHGRETAAHADADERERASWAATCPSGGGSSGRCSSTCTTPTRWTSTRCTPWRVIAEHRARAAGRGPSPVRAGVPADRRSRGAVPGHAAARHRQGRRGRAGEGGRGERAQGRRPPGPGARARSNWSAGWWRTTWP